MQTHQTNRSKRDQAMDLGLLLKRMPMNHRTYIVNRHVSNFNPYFCLYNHIGCKDGLTRASLSGPDSVKISFANVIKFGGAISAHCLRCS
jgi:hypothetical protein